tara:strand:- start:7458 stop:8294 length:837 start_codon:yes stop_codon:yes gene_type:complete
MLNLLPTLFALLSTTAPTSPAPNLSTTLATTLAVAPTVVVPQDDPDSLPDKREEVAEMLVALKDHAGARNGAEDREAIAVMENLVKEFEKSGPKDRKAIVGAVSNALKEKRKEDKDGNRDNRIFIGAAEALGQMGPESVKPLESWIGHKAHKKDLALQRKLILALGLTKDEKSIDTLLDLLKNKDATLQAAASEALGNHSGRDEKARKEIFEEVLKIVTAAHNLVEQNVTDNIARERYDAIKGSMITTLQIMSGESLREPNDFRTWWNKNKKKNWDED